MIDTTKFISFGYTILNVDEISYMTRMQPFTLKIILKNGIELREIFSDAESFKPIEAAIWKMLSFEPPSQ